MTPRVPSIFMSAVLSAFWAGSALAGNYSIVVIDPPNRDPNIVPTISDTGEVIWFGSVTGANGGNYTWNNGVFTPFTSPCSVMIAVNARGVVAGTTSFDERACVVSPKGRSIALPLPATVQNMTPAAINKSGRVVGYAQQAGSAYTGFTSLGKTVTLIHPPGAGTQTSLSAISSSGLIGGVATTADDKSSFAFTYRDGTYKTINTRDGTSPFAGAPGFITESGLIGGNIVVYQGEFGFSATEGFVLNGSTLTVYKYPGSGNTNLVGISKDGSILGNYEDGSGHMHGFVVSSGHYSTLNIPGDLGSTISGVNSSGSIVGRYYATSNSNENGVDVHSFVGVCAPSDQPCNN